MRRVRRWPLPPPSPMLLVFLGLLVMVVKTKMPPWGGATQVLIEQPSTRHVLFFAQHSCPLLPGRLGSIVRNTWPSYPPPLWALWALCICTTTLHHRLLSAVPFSNAAMFSLNFRCSRRFRFAAHVNSCVNQTHGHLSSEPAPRARPRTTGTTSSTNNTCGTSSGRISGRLSAHRIPRHRTSRRRGGALVSVDETKRAQA